MSKEIVIAKKEPRGGVEVLEEPELKTDIKPITTAKKPSFGQRFKSAIFSTDGGTVSSYIVHDIIVPAVKKTVSDILIGGVNMSMYGRNDSAPGMYRERERSYYNYAQTRQPSYARRDTPAPRTATKMSFEDVILEDRMAGEEVLSTMDAIIEQYGFATVSDFYQLVGMSSIHTDFNYGWTNLATAYVKDVRRGYIIQFPRPVPVGN